MSFGDGLDIVVLGGDLFLKVFQFCDEDGNGTHPTYLVF